MHILSERVRAVGLSCLGVHSKNKHRQRRVINPPPSPHTALFEGAGNTVGPTLHLSVIHDDSFNFGNLSIAPSLFDIPTHSAPTHIAYHPLILTHTN